jgi:tetratricopeptide (TPR) repeat protein
LPTAYEAYVRGRHAWNKRTEPDLRVAIRLFQESIDADPAYAPAFAGLADAYAQLGYGSYVAPEESFLRARAAAMRAVELDPTLPEAHAALAFALMYYDWDFAGAELEYKQALTLNPGSARSRRSIASLRAAVMPPAMRLPWSTQASAIERLHFQRSSGRFGNDPIGSSGSSATRGGTTSVRTRAFVL